MDFQPLRQAFQDQIDRQRLPGTVMQVCQHGKVIYAEALGKRDPAAGDAMTSDAIFRIYSMTKPITSVAVMMLIEAGEVGLDDLASVHFPEFSHLEVGVEVPGSDGQPTLERVPAERQMTIRDLLRHTSGLTYGLFEKSLVKDLYLRSGVEGSSITNQTLIAKLGELPLAYQPGTVWEYSRSTDVLGALIERISGLSLGEFFQQRILGPLEMVDTGFSVPPEKQHRLAQPYALDPDTQAPVRVLDPRKVPSFESGGGGLMSTVADYQRFQNLMLGHGTLGDIRLLKPETVDMMTRDHLGNMHRGRAYLPGPDYGFGLGVAVRHADGATGHAGDYFWGGLAGTFQWIDPAIGLTAIYMMQGPNQRDEFRALFRTHVYRALANA